MLHKIIIIVTKIEFVILLIFSISLFEFVATFYLWIIKIVGIEVGVMLFIKMILMAFFFFFVFLLWIKIIIEVLLVFIIIKFVVVTIEDLQIQRRLTRWCPNLLTYGCILSFQKLRVGCSNVFLYCFVNVIGDLVHRLRDVTCHLIF